MLHYENIKARGFNLRTIWDLFMIVVAIANLALILFDFSYLYLRPYYLKHLPAVVHAYDPYKGIEPHPLTQRYEELAREWFEPITDEERHARVARELRALSVKMEDNNPFAFSGQAGSLKIIEAYMRQRLIAEGSVRADELPLHFAGVAELFWVARDPVVGSVGQNPVLTRLEFEDRRRLWNENVPPLLDLNYRRAFDQSGNFVDHFIWLDAPFLILFWIEFFARWWIAVRQRRYRIWWLFPIVHFYDVLSLIPLAEFRPFRLLRVISIYLRLHRSELTKVGEDFLSRTVKRYSGILTEEISDMVAVRLLTEAQEEVRTGVTIDVFLGALAPRRDEIKTVLLGYIRRYAESQPGSDGIEKLLAESLEDAARRVPSLTLIPNLVKETLTREIGVAVYSAINDTIRDTLRGERGEDSLEELVDFILDDILTEGRDSELGRLYQDVAVDVLENMKAAVAEKKWEMRDKMAAAAESERP